MLREEAHMTLWHLLLLCNFFCFSYLNISHVLAPASVGQAVRLGSAKTVHLCSTDVSAGSLPGAGASKMVSLTHLEHWCW